MSRTWETLVAPGEQVGETETPSRKAEGNQGVGSVHNTQRRLGRSHGEGTDRDTQLIKETHAGHEGPGIVCILNVSNSKRLREWSCGSEYL
ncbi:hypothetical protein ACFLV7_06935 [Chloroflexota bacterium]